MSITETRWGIACPDCLDKQNRKAIVSCSLLGWWGIPWGILKYYLYSSDKEILFTIEWDSFFFLIATDHKKMDKLIANDLFEGFLCNDKTEHYWEYTFE